jgi:hypothetical protein
MWVDREVAMTHTSIRCLLRLHRYHWYSTDDGSRYQRCERCGHDRGPSEGGPGYAAAGWAGGGGGGGAG